MKQNLYGKKLFIADLLIVGLWALFAWHFAWGRIVTPAMIVLRISLSFMIYQKSRWAFFNAAIYATMFVGIIFNMPSIDIDFEPIGKIAYVGCCLFGFSDWAVKAFDLRNHVHIETALYVFGGTYMAWLIIMPIICTWNRKGIMPILKHQRKIWWYIGGVLAFFTFIWFTDKDSSIFIGGVLLSLSPLVYRVVYHRGRPSILQSILQDKIFIDYLAAVSVLLGAIFIGLYEVNGAKPFAAFLFPIILYIIAIRISNVKGIKTSPALLLGLAGFLQLLVYNRFHENVIVLLIVAGVLSCMGVFLTYRQTRALFSSLLLLTASIFVLPVTLLGYNPYAVIEANEVLSLSYIRNGLYQFQNNGKLGLRDRYGIIVHANYDRYELLGKERIARDYMVVYSDVWFWDDYAIENIYDLKNRRFIMPDDAPDSLHHIEKIHDKVYGIFDREDHQVYSFRLPGVFDWGYDCDMRLIACDSEEGDKVELPEDLSDMTITKSNDGKLTLYAFDTGGGGTSPAFETYIQFNANDSIITDFLFPLSESDYICSSEIKRDGVDVYEGSFSKIIAQISLSETETGYLIDAYNKASSVEAGHEVVLVKFVDGKLKKLPWVTKSGAIRNSVGCYYYIPDWYFTTDGLGWDWVMSFNKETGTLYVPEDCEMVMTDHYDLYRFKDGKMRHDGYGSGFWLHPSLHDFNYLAGIYQTDTNLIRVDALGVGEGYRYASWGKSKNMASKPDLVLYGGNTGLVENAIVFKNSDYTYIVPEYRRGQGKDFGKVIVKYKDKVIAESDV